jgi:hypothetical protein
MLKWSSISELPDRLEPSIDKDGVLLLLFQSLAEDRLVTEELRLRPLLGEVARDIDE